MKYAIKNNVGIFELHDDSKDILPNVAIKLTDIQFEQLFNGTCSFNDLGEIVRTPISGRHLCGNGPNRRRK